MTTNKTIRIDLNAARDYDFGFAQNVIGIILKLGYIGTTISGWNMARKTRDVLSKLSDHTLNDIGICRADIAAISFR
ncbi:MAG TPA: hypothetical protein DD729_00235 [Rhodobacteraceae bacterium]|jgi:uncharacterized protein YjiS (DUF1127 family)|nr:hypothetical protein [Paracoccaceae bacterium]